MIEGIYEENGVKGRSESGERLLEMCAEHELVVAWYLDLLGVDSKQ